MDKITEEKKLLNEMETVLEVSTRERKKDTNTEHQKKHNFFRATLTSIHIIEINDVWTRISEITVYAIYFTRVLFSRILRIGCYSRI